MRVRQTTYNARSTIASKSRKIVVVGSHLQETSGIWRDKSTLTARRHMLIIIVIKEKARSIERTKPGVVRDAGTLL